MKHPKHLWFTAILVSLLQFGICSNAQMASPQTGQENESFQPKPFKGEVYATLDGHHRITITSPDEVEVSEDDQNIVCKYTMQDGKLRILKTVLGTTTAEYFQVTTDGLQDSRGNVYFNPNLLAAAQDNNQGINYANGQGVVKDEAEAVKWFRKAAEQNYVPAQNDLAICNDKGQGVAKDEAEAVKWFHKAAEQNYVPAQDSLGFHYANGQGVAKDEVEAVKWFRKAAEQNFAEAQWGLGNCYANGQGVAKDEVEAVNWYRKAAEQNYAPAQNVLALLKTEAEAQQQMKQAQQQMKQLETEAQRNPANITNLIILGGAYLGMQQTNRAVELFETALARPEVKFTDAAVVAQFFAQTGDYPKLELALKKMVSLAPDQPEPLYDLAALQATTGEQTEALQNLKTALNMSAQRLAKNPSARDLVVTVRSDNRFDRIRSLPEFQKIVSPK